MAFIPGAKTYFSDSNDHILDLKNGLDFLDVGNGALALLKRIGTNGFTAKSVKHEWTEVALAARSETVTLADGSATTLTVSDAYIYQVNELLRIENEVVRITALASATACSPMALRVASLMKGEGASSMIFWWRRWMEHSRSLR